MTELLTLSPEVLTEWQQQVGAGHHMHTVRGYFRHGKSAQERLHFLHGNGFCALTLASLASQFPQDWNIWLTDVPGHGGSVQPKHRMPDWQAMAESVAQSIKRQAGGEALIGIGHSMGGVMTLLAAARHPTLFSRIILLDPVLFSPEIILGQQLLRTTGVWKRGALVRAVTQRRQQWPDAESMRAELLSKGLYRDWQPQVMDDFIRGGTVQEGDEIRLSCNPRWEGAIFGSYPRGLWHAVRSVKVPVDILVAENSYGFIQRSARRAGKVNSNIRWQVFPGTHCFPMERPFETAAKLDELIAQPR